MALGAWLRASLAAAIIGLSTLVPGQVPAMPAAQAQWSELPGDAFNAQGSALKATVYVSAGAQARGKAPLLVLLHGCEQDAASFFTDSGWQDVADRHGLIVLLPEQQHNLFAMVGGASRYGNPLGCFNFADRLTSPLKGGVPREAGAIVSMIDALRAGKGLDPAGSRIEDGHIYVSGLSAGAGMAATLLADYPQVFAGGALFAGVPALCAQSMTSAASLCGISVMRACGEVKARTGGYDSREWAKAVQRASHPKGSPKGSPRVLIVQGTADCTVDPANALYLTNQWTAFHGLPADRPTVIGQEPSWPDRAVRKGYAPAGANDLWVESVLLAGVGHVMPIATGDPNRPCGRVRASEKKTYIEDVGFCGAALAADFFHLTP
ncbi:extracellular catalytic domain type 1 short-chain-length polyhydroxyalkanoate depolymerase [Azospirillum canadense]|uniref:extracellular catalytic domain type 1 short-chain-length polyhydroxyalkanoate depolymerase n=1 Tax=Azospirillum canadense TaxID=403962 RepID=UPI0022271173|nr:PHB depolymerase family esterase [Azospirillum canadense]MCW2236288.1 feruloyl esterase [Azospirillum canadense]